MFEDEIRRIFAEQSKHYTDLNNELLERIIRIVIDQRPLKKPKIGSCRFFVEDSRAPLALPSQQRFRILQEVANLEVREGLTFRKLSSEEREEIIRQLSLTAATQHTNKAGTELTFAKIRAKIVGDSSVHFNLEELGRKGLLVDAAAAALSQEDCFGKRWFSLTLETQDEIVLKLTGNEEKEIQDEDDSVRSWLMNNHKLTDSQAENILHAKLPDGFGRLGRKALVLILPHLEAGMMYSEAVEAAGLEDPSNSVRLHKELPYYGEILTNYTMPHPAHGRLGFEDEPEVRHGRIPNPTVHIGLNQVRRVVNSLIARFGPPQIVRIELARNFAFSANQANEEKKQNRQNRVRNDRAREEIQKAGQDPKNRDNLLRFKLWEELSPSDPLQRRCPFSGRTISITQLFSSEIEIEHILPFSRTFDDSFNNKTLCFRDYNRMKLNQTPFEAFRSRAEYGKVPC